MSTNSNLNTDFKSAREIEDQGKENCARCIRLNRVYIGRIDPKKGQYFCKNCMDELSIVTDSSLATTS